MMTAMSSPAEMTPRERNDSMLARIRSAEPDPYREGGYVLRVLTTPGRRTGQPRSWPIAVIQRDGQHYICGPNRQRDWVRNLLAAGWCTVEGDEPARHDVTLIESPEAADVVGGHPRWPRSACTCARSPCSASNREQPDASHPASRPDAGRDHGRPPVRTGRLRSRTRSYRLRRRGRGPAGHGRNGGPAGHRRLPGGHAQPLLPGRSPRALLHRPPVPP